MSLYIRDAFIWGAISKILDAAIKFVSVPLLLTYFGRDNFGLIALAISVNAYLQILDLGVNTGSIKYFSEWIALKKMTILDSVARTSIGFYGLIGLINALVLLPLAFWGVGLFSLNVEESLIFKQMLLILAFVAIFNWAFSVFNQLLTADENIIYIQKLNIVKSVFGFVVILATLYFEWSIIQYFSWFIISSTIIIIPAYLKSKSSGLISSILPRFDWVHFKPILKYSLAIILMGVFQMTATKMRPIILGSFSSNGVGIIADYRIMETITIFIVSIGGLFISIFLPKTSKLMLENDKKKISTFAYRGTSYTSIVCVVLCMPFLINSKEILQLYVGDEFSHLYVWLNVWIVTILFYLHNTPVASLVLASGKTKMLVYSSAIACVVSLVINAVLVGSMEVGSAVIGYAIYVFIQFNFYYLYFNKNVLKIESLKVFKSFVVPCVFGFVPVLLLNELNLHISNLMVLIIVRSLIWSFFFGAFLFGFGVVKLSDIKALLLDKKSL